MFPAKQKKKVTAQPYERRHHERNDPDQLGNEGGDEASDRGRDGMARRAAESSAKRAKKEKEDPLVRRREELILEVANARVALKAQGNKAVREATESLMQALRAVCAKLEAKNRNELLKKLPDELWEKIVDESVHQNDLLALAMTCRFFRDTTKRLGK